MRIPRIYSSTPLSRESRIFLDERALHYVARVLRLKPGAELSLFDGKGREYRAILGTAGKREAEVEILEQIERDVESTLQIVLGQGISRGERMDYALQKAVELGVKRIVPLLTERSGVNLSSARAEKRQRHWQGVAISACEQCGRNYVPLVEGPQSLAAFLSSCRSEAKILLDPGSKWSLKELSPPLDNKLVLLIGSEGGLSEGEIKQAQQAGFMGIRFGPRILRTETATVVALSALQLCWGDL